MLDKISKELNRVSNFKAESLLTKRDVTSSFDKTLFHSIDPTNWYKTFPFYFEIRDLSKDSSTPEMRFFLPIPPSSMTVQQLSTAEAIATFNGVIEETSAGVFSVITLTGTTGMSSSAPELNGVDDVLLNTKFRKELSELTNSGNVLGRLINNSINLAESIANGILGGESILPYAKFGSAVSTPPSEYLTTLSNKGQATSETAGNKFLGLFGASPAKPSVFSNGFAWDLALRQMFLIYQREKAINPNLAMFFVDAKRTVQYRVVIRSASFNNKADMPFMSNYNIQMKAWQISSIDTGVTPSMVDRFGKDGDLKEVLSGSLTGSVTKISNTIRALNRGGSVVGTFARNTIGTGL